MPVLNLWKYKYSAFSALGTMSVVFFWPALPLRGIINWLEFFYYYTPQNILYGAMTILSGLYVGLYVYNKRVCKTCSVGTGKTGTASVLGGILLGACPACIPALAIFLPLGITVFLSSISWVFLVLSIAVIAYLIYKMNGFRST